MKIGIDDLIFVKQNKKPKAMNLQILKKANFPKSYSSKDQAFSEGAGDNFFILPDGSYICVSENDEIYSELINNGFKTELQMYLERN